jgi:hypothetical protein
MRKVDPAGVAGAMRGFYPLKVSELHLKTKKSGRNSNSSCLNNKKEVDMAQEYKAVCQKASCRHVEYYNKYPTCGVRCPKCGSAMVPKKVEDR